METFLSCLPASSQFSSQSSCLFIFVAKRLGLQVPLDTYCVVQRYLASPAREMNISGMWAFARTCWHRPSHFLQGLCHWLGISWHSWWTQGQVHTCSDFLSSADGFPELWDSWSCPRVCGMSENRPSTAMPLFIFHPRGEMQTLTKNALLSHPRLRGGRTSSPGRAGTQGCRMIEVSAIYLLSSAFYRRDIWAPAPVFMED